MKTRDIKSQLVIKFSDNLQKKFETALNRTLLLRGEKS